MTAKNDNKSKERQNRRSSLKRMFGWFTANRDLAKAWVIFVSFTVIAFVVAQTPWCAKQILAPMNIATAGCSAWIINLMGTDVETAANMIMSPVGGVSIAEGCNSIYATIIFLAGILAFPTSWRKKLIGVVLGTVALFVINLIRVVTLFYLSGSNRKLFDEAHLYIWQFAIIIVGGLLWLLWYDKIVNRQSAPSGL